MTREVMAFINAMELRVQHLERAHLENSKRIHSVEQKSLYLAPDVALKEAAVKATVDNLYAPLRNDTRAVLDLAAFARRLIDMQDLGYAVTDEVRELAKRALGLTSTRP